MTSLSSVVNTVVVTTVTATSTATATATRYIGFVLQRSTDLQFGSVAPASGFSASGVKFDTNEASAQSFEYQNGLLFLEQQSIRAHQQTSGSYYLMTNPGFGVFGYYTSCDLSFSTGAASGCVVSGYVGESGVFPSASGNNDQNYGVWFVTGDKSGDQLTVFAIGQT